MVWNDANKIYVCVSYFVNFWNVYTEHEREIEAKGSKSVYKLGGNVSPKNHR